MPEPGDKVLLVGMVFDRPGPDTSIVVRDRWGYHYLDFPPGSSALTPTPDQPEGEAARSSTHRGPPRPEPRWEEGVSQYPKPESEVTVRREDAELAAHHLARNADEIDRVIGGSHLDTGTSYAAIRDAQREAVERIRAALEGEAT